MADCVSKIGFSSAILIELGRLSLNLNLSASPSFSHTRISRYLAARALCPASVLPLIEIATHNITEWRLAPVVSLQISLLLSYLRVVRQGNAGVADNLINRFRAHRMSELPYHLVLGRAVRAMSLDRYPRISG